MARVIMDLDGVNYDFGASVRKYVQDHINPNAECPEPLRWEFYEDWGYDLEEFKRWCHDGVNLDIIFNYGGPHPRAKEAWDMLRANGHTIHVATDRPFGKDGKGEAITRSWLDRYGLKFDSLTFTADKTIVAGDVAIDDKVENHDALEAAGIDSYLLTRAWNKHSPTNKRVLDVYHFAELVLHKY